MEKEAQMSTKPIIALDFDGVIHGYSRGWQDGSIYDPVVSGFFEWAEEARKHFRLMIYSSRSKTEDGRRSMENWLSRELTAHVVMRDLMGKYPNSNDVPMDHRTIEINLDEWFEFANEKPPAFLTIDDRAIRFDGNWSDSHLRPEMLKVFKPWMNR
jgi:hypothetical protein